MGHRRAPQRSARPRRAALSRAAPAGDDDALLASLQAGGATEEVEADWQGAVVGRAASACLRRWRVMLKHVAQPAEQGFQGCVEQLLDIRAKQLAKKAAAAEEG